MKQNYLNWCGTCYGEKTLHLCMYICMHNNNCYDFWKNWPLSFIWWNSFFHGFSVFLMGQPWETWLCSSPFWCFSSAHAQCRTSTFPEPLSKCFVMHFRNPFPVWNSAKSALCKIRHLQGWIYGMSCQSHWLISFLKSILYKQVMKIWKTLLVVNN